jgi:hypothetical protein
MGNRPKVDKQKFIQDIRAGLTRESLRSKYQMTETAFQNLLSQLLEKGRLTNGEMRNLKIPQPEEGAAAIGIANIHAERFHETYGNGTHVGAASEAPSHERDYWYTWIDGFLIGPISQRGLCDIVKKEADDSDDLRALGPFSAEELRDMGVPESSLEKPILSFRPTPPLVGLSDIAGQGEIRALPASAYFWLKSKGGHA